MSARRAIVVFATVLLQSGPVVAAPPTVVPAAKIAAGTALVVDSETDPEFALIDAKVDIGRIRQIGEAVEAELAWTLHAGALSDARASRAGIDIPDGSASVDRERVVCRADGALSYAIETRIVAPDGRVLDRRAFDPEAARRKAEAQDAELRKLSPMGIGYGPDPRSLVCAAAARRCDGRDFVWPPSPNRTPLERSARADAMRKAYAAGFVPSCKLAP